MTSAGRPISRRNPVRLDLDARTWREVSRQVRARDEVGILVSAPAR